MCDVDGEDGNRMAQVFEGATPRGRRVPLRWVLIAAVVCAIAVIEVGSFVRLAERAAQPPITPEQLLTQAQAAAAFPIKQPGWLPDGARLANVTFNAGCPGCSAAGHSTVLLLYALASGGSVELAESDHAITYQYEYQDASGLRKAVPMDAQTSTTTVNGVPATVEVLTETRLPGTPVGMVTVSWVADGVTYHLASATASASDLLAIAASM